MQMIYANVELYDELTPTTYALRDLWIYYKRRAIELYVRAPAVKGKV